MITPAGFTYQEMDSEQNRIGLSLIAFDFVRLVQLLQLQLYLNLEI